MDNYNFYRNTHKNSSRSFFSYFITGVIGAVIGGMLVLMFAPAALLGKAVSQQDSKTQAPQNITSEKVIIPQKVEVSPVTAVAKKVMPAVVGIRTTEYRNNMFFGKTKVEGVGSGVIVDSNGYILTNNHVAGEESSNITVYLADGREVPGKILWTDSGLDLSVVKIQAGNLTVAELGDSDSLEVGDMAVAIGNPLGLRFERSVTSGIVSALNRSIPLDDNKIMEDLIQTDASINQGNSGGPLLNSEGKVIGINTIKVTSAEGMGFAIPVNIATPIVKSFVETGSFKTPYIGITGLDKEIASFYNYDIKKGIYVAAIDRVGPAYKAGMRKGDIMVEINDAPVNTVTSMKHAIYSAGVGNSIKVKLNDSSGNEKIVTVTLTENEE